MIEKDNGNTGKQTEKALIHLFKQREHDITFWWHQFPDAARCRGRVGKRPADFIIKEGKRSILIDPKDCIKEGPVPTKRLSQAPKMKLFNMTSKNEDAFFIINFYVAGYVNVLSAELVDKTKPSIDLRKTHIRFPSLEAAMEAIRGGSNGRY